MANAAVDKLKAFGLRQGEKFVVGIAATVFVVALGVLATSATIPTTPDELQKKAESANSNLSRKQEPDAILTKIQEAGIVDPGFVKIVENQTANALNPNDFHVRLDWVTPEPGAGLIRDQPELIAPTELLAFPGRGGALLYALNEKGERIPDPAKASTGGFGGRPGSARGDEAKKGAEPAPAKADRRLAGAVEETKKAAEPAKAEESEAEAIVDGKEETTGKRWVVITAVVDNETLNKNWLTALKNPAIAYPQYVKVDTERQVQGDDNAWSEWAAIDEDAKYKVLDNMPEKEPELVPAALLSDALVDPLPFLRAGYWSGVHVARLVPAELRNASSPDDNPNIMQGSRRQGGMAMGMGMGEGMGSRPMGGGGMGAMGAMGGRPMGGGRGGMGAMGPMGGGGEGGAAMSGQPEDTVVANAEPTLMIRSLDFTVQPNTTYRYRIRLVIKNPNFERSDVNPGTNISDKNLLGPWSEPTGAVTVPSDVSIYTQVAGQDARRDDVVSFQVFRWDPNKGETVVKTDDAGPGFLVGEYGTISYPSAEGTGSEMKAIDFNSRSFVLDAIGGRLKIPDIGVERNPFTVPAEAMIVEPDGGIVIRTQAEDLSDDVRRDMESNYKQAISDSGKKREPPRRRNNRSGGRPGGGGGS